MRAASRASSIPSSTGMLNRPWLSVEINPTVNVRLRNRLCARSFGRKARRSAAKCTRLRVSLRNCPRPLRALETVLTLTPAACATSQMVAGVFRSARRLCLATLHPHLVGRSQLFTKPAPQATENLFLLGFGVFLLLASRTDPGERGPLGQPEPRADCMIDRAST